MRYLAAVEPFYLEDRAHDSIVAFFLLGIVGLVTAGVGLMFLFQSGSRVLGFLLFLGGAVGLIMGVPPLVSSMNSFETNQTKFIAWTKDTYGITLKKSDLIQLEGDGVLQDDGSFLIQKRTDDGGILLYKRVPPEEDRSTIEPVEPLPGKSD